MDQLRQIRYVVAPFFFLASIIWGRYLENPSSLLMLSAPIFGAIAGSFFPIGFLISALGRLGSATLFGVASKFRRDRFIFHEVILPETTRERMWGDLRLYGKIEQRL